LSILRSIERGRGTDGQIVVVLHPGAGQVVVRRQALQFQFVYRSQPDIDAFFSAKSAIIVFLIEIGCPDNIDARNALIQSAAVDRVAPSVVKVRCNRASSVSSDPEPALEVRPGVHTIDEVRGYTLVNTEPSEIERSVAGFLLETQIGVLKVFVGPAVETLTPEIVAVPPSEIK